MVLLKQLLPRQVLKLTDDPGEALVDEIHGVPNPALSMELEMQGVSADLDVLATERREAVRAVGLPVLVVADADQGRVEKADERGKEAAEVRHAASPWPLSAWSRRRGRERASGSVQRGSCGGSIRAATPRSQIR